LVVRTSVSSRETIGVIFLQTPMAIDKFTYTQMEFRTKELS